MNKDKIMKKEKTIIKHTPGVVTTYPLKYAYFVMKGINGNKTKYHFDVNNIFNMSIDYDVNMLNDKITITGTLKKVVATE